jgi:Domain of unknown function (DUF5753)
LRETPSPYDLSHTVPGGIATRSSTFQVAIVPSLLQTADYARVVYRAQNPHLHPDTVDCLVAVLAQRQKVLTKQHPLRMHAVLDEAALHRPIGNRAVMAAQLEHLTEASERSNVTVQVLPYIAGAYPSMTTGFSLLDFSDPGDLPAVVQDEYAGSTPTGEPELAERFSTAFDILTASAMPLKRFCGDGIG